MGVGLAVVLACACGGDGGRSADAKALGQAAVDAVMEPGMVFHAKTDEGSEIWIDGERDLFRGQTGERGDKLSYWMGVGEGWTVWSLDGLKNEVEEEELEPSVEFPSAIDNPAVVLGLGPLANVAYGQDVEVVGEKVSEGRDVVVVETRWAMEEYDNAAGTTAVWRVELDRESHLVVATEWQVILPEGEREEEEESDGVQRVVYETEFIPREELPDDFFSPEVVYDAVVTFEERLEEVRALGFEPYWLGERFEAKEGELVLSSVWDVDANEKIGEAALRYSLFTPRYDASYDGLGGVVVITLKPGDVTFLPPRGRGTRPELEEAVTVQGQEATLYTSALKPEASTCAEGLPCIAPDVPLYHRLVVSLDDTAIQIMASAKARPDLGEDENPFDNRDALISLAEALVSAE